MTLRCETSAGAGGLDSAIANTLREICKIRGGVELVGADQLPNDGIVIDDIRQYD